MTSRVDAGDLDLTWVSWTKLCERMGLERSYGMPKKRFSAEQIVVLPRQIEVLMSQGKTAPIACREAGISQQLRDECLNGEIFYSLKEATVVIEQWRNQYNTIRPHSSLN